MFFLNGSADTITMEAGTEVFVATDAAPCWDFGNAQW